MGDAADNTADEPEASPAAQDGEKLTGRTVGTNGLWTDTIARTAHNDVFLNAPFAFITLGPLESWEPALRAYATMVLADSRSAGIFWGRDKVSFYNEQYPEATELEAVFEKAATTGQTVDVDNILLFLERHGYVEETYFIGQYIPWRGESGEVEGFYNTAYESTAQVLARRRRHVVDRLAAVAPAPVEKTVTSFVEVLRTNPHDITAVMLYSFDELAEAGKPNLYLKGSIGFPEGHPCSPEKATLETAENGLIPLFRHVKLSKKPYVITTRDGAMQSYAELFDGVSWCGYGEPANDIVICPLIISGTLLGFYVQGTNPRRAYDEVTAVSITDVTSQMEVKWINAVTAEEAHLRQKVLEKRAADSEDQLQHMAHNAPVGMCQIGPDHRIHWANDQFYDITGHDRSKPNLADFNQVLAEGEQVRAEQTVEELLGGASRTIQEYRLAKPWTAPVSEEEGTTPPSAWMLAVSFPLTENGKVKHLMAYVSDISRQKWAESVQTRNAAAADLARQRQEEFIDVTSHEMRNPLTAITQLADGIAKSVQADDSNDVNSWREAAQESAFAASTILACAAHQRRVIDDVLMLSRLDSHMLSITPVVGRPSEVVASTMKIFDGEVAINGTEISATFDESYSSQVSDWVLVDTSRLTQILINLVSNAIKFTASCQTRRIKVTVGQQVGRPESPPTPLGDLAMVPPRSKNPTNTALPELEDGNPRQYHYFCIQDIGPGITPQQMERLFERFSQATPKTHITYGGSGLGLYISRELAEKQGGGVGVASKPGEGTVFAFYIETRPAVAPENLAERSRSAPQLSVTPSTEHGKYWQTTASRAVTEGHNPQDAATTASPSSMSQGEVVYDILLVEDNLVNQKVLASQLRRAKCNVFVANDGVEALEVLKKAECWVDDREQGQQSSPVGRTRIQIVLMDIEMPVMNGLECTKRIRNFEREGQITRHLPIIAVTANVRGGQRNKAFQAGVDSFFPKPFTVEELLKMIKDVVKDNTP